MRHCPGYVRSVLITTSKLMMYFRNSRSLLPC